MCEMTPGIDESCCTRFAFGCGLIQVTSLFSIAGARLPCSMTNLNTSLSSDGFTAPYHLSFLFSTTDWSRLNWSITYGPPDHVGTVAENQSAAEFTPSGLDRSKPCLVARCAG